MSKVFSFSIRPWLGFSLISILKTPSSFSFRVFNKGMYFTKDIKNFGHYAKPDFEIKGVYVKFH